jgi:hypothetical protein
VISRLVGFLLLFEAALTIAWLTSLLSTMRVYGALTIVLMAARAVVGALQFVAWVLLSRTTRGAGTLPPSAVPIARAAVSASAVLFVAEVGFRLSPSNLDPTFRWMYVLAYWLYAGVVLAVLARIGRAQ